MENMNEISIEWVRGQNNATVSAYSNSKIKGKIQKLKESYPEEVDIYENEDGSILAHIPIKYVKISHPKIVSEENKKKSADRFAKIRERKNE